MPDSGPHGDRHLHVHLTDQHTTYYDLVTEFLQAAGKAPDWFWRVVGSFGPHEAEKMEEIISTAFEAGAFVSHDHPEDVEFDWVTEEECEQERLDAEERVEGEEPPERSSPTSSGHAAPRSSARP
ncbi:MAG: hypothetical protein ACLQD8_03000 [Thermoplasmata archaeon]